MTVLQQFLRRPQRLWVRQLNFQVHLWAGIILSLYMIVIGITGSILVFRGELETAGGWKPWHGIKAGAPFADLATVIDNVKASFPRAQIISVFAPSDSDPAFVAVIQSFSRARAEIRVAADPKTGAVLGRFPDNTNSWLRWLERLHETLLLGPGGRRINGYGGAVLLLLNLTGIVIWWPGLQTWTRALTVDFRRNWRRINFDMHRSIGFWTLAISSLWAISAVYFGWPAETITYVNRVSPLVSARPPVVTVVPQRTAMAPDLGALIAQASALDPGTTFMGIGFPSNRRAPLRVLMRRRNSPGYEYADTLFFDPYTGEYLSTWRYGVNESLGDWLIWLQVPLHFGTYWGLGVKILWAIAGLAIPLLTVTGALMYWNRALRRKWKHLAKSTARRAPQPVSLN